MVESTACKVLVGVGDDKEIDELEVNSETRQMLLNDPRFVSFKIKQAEEDKDDLVVKMDKFTISQGADLDLRPLSPA